MRSNIALRLRDFPRAKPEGTPEGEGLYWTVYPEFSPNTGSNSLLRIIMLMIPSLISLTTSPYCEISVA